MVGDETAEGSVGGTQARAHKLKREGDLNRNFFLSWNVIIIENHYEICKQIFQVHRGVHVS